MERITTLVTSQEIKRNPQGSSFSSFWPLVVYHVSFFIFISTIGLNIIFGIIVDTFSELRDLKVNVFCCICMPLSVSQRERGRVCECSDVIYVRLSLQWRAESDMKDTCFICSRNSYDFEHHGKVGKARMQLSIISIFFSLHTFYSLVLYSSLCHLFYTPP